MFGFLQGFAYGLFVSCAPWFLAGMINPALAVPGERPNRLQVVLRYWLLLPFVAFVLWLTSLWGGFGPTVAGWIAGLAAVAVALPVEHGWRRWRARQRERRDAEARRRARAEQEAAARESGLAELDPENPPEDADALVRQLCTVKRRLLQTGRNDSAVHVDRLYSRYSRVASLLSSRFDPAEVTHERALGLLTEVCRGALDDLQAMARRAESVRDVDGGYVRRRLHSERDTLTPEERQALERRLELLQETDDELRRIAGRLEPVMTALDDTLVSVARIDTGRSHASVDAEQAMLDLQRFSAGAGRYGRTGGGGNQ